MSIKTVSVNKPTAHLAINKGRIKMYGKKKSIPTYYLEKGQEFQIELYNPTQEKVLTTFKFNNKAISGGLILRPGERVFLDRYLDTKKKFLFDTYKVENSKKSRNAIEPNGDIEIAFFKELTQFMTTTGTVTLDWLNEDYQQDIFIPCRTTTDSDSNYNITLANNTTNDVSCFSGQQIDGNAGIGTTSNQILFSNSASNINLDGDVTIDGDLSVSGSIRSTKPKKKAKSLKSKKTKVPKEIETGRVEQGSKSNQSLCEGTGDFEMTSFHVARYKLVPKSQKKVSTKEYYVKYCHDCGAKCKTKFCSLCGAKQ